MNNIIDKLRLRKQERDKELNKHNVTYDKQIVYKKSKMKLGDAGINCLTKN